MRFYKFLFILTFLAAPVIFQSCSTDIAGVDSWADPDYNTSPNSPDDVTVDLLLPSGQGAIAYLNGGDLGRYTSVWTQHHGGTERQHAGIDQYRVTESDVNNSWATMYAGGMNAVYAMINKANEEGSPHYSGVGKILMAMYLGAATDLWGNIPYSQAFLGADNLTPTYDSQEQIYATIDQLLSEGVSEVGAASSVRSPGGDDLMYGGDLGAWAAIGQSLRARYALHLSARNGSSAYSAALNHVSNGIADNAGDLIFDQFGTAAPQQNPWFQFEDQRGDIVMGHFFVELMKSMGDPRLAPYTSGTVDRGTEETPNEDYFGSPAGNPNANSSRMGAYYASPSSAVPLMTYVEQKFIEAEAAHETDDKARAAAAHNEAIIASLNKLGVYDQAYVDAQASETAESISLEKIMTQKYIALYTQMETYTDWRRTGLPALEAAANTNGVIPVRFPYPQSERLYNGGNVPSTQIPANLFEPLWWDM